MSINEKEKKKKELREFLSSSLSKSKSEKSDSENESLASTAGSKDANKYVDDEMDLSRQVSEISKNSLYFSDRTDLSGGTENKSLDSQKYPENFESKANELNGTEADDFLHLTGETQASNKGGFLGPGTVLEPSSPEQPRSQLALTQELLESRSKEIVSSKDNAENILKFTQHHFNNIKEKRIDDNLIESLINYKVGSQKDMGYTDPLLRLEKLFNDTEKLEEIESQLTQMKNSNDILGTDFDKLKDKFKELYEYCKILNDLKSRAERDIYNRELEIKDMSEKDMSVIAVDIVINQLLAKDLLKSQLLSNEDKINIKHRLQQIISGNNKKLESTQSTGSREKIQKIVNVHEKLLSKFEHLIQEFELTQEKQKPRPS